MLKTDAAEWGFHGKNTKAIKFFNLLPIYPEITTKKDICKEMKLTGKELGYILRGLPPNAPIIEDEEEIARLK